MEQQGDEMENIALDQLLKDAYAAQSHAGEPGAKPFTDEHRAAIINDTAKKQASGAERTPQQITQERRGRF